MKEAWKCELHCPFPTSPLLAVQFFNQNGINWLFSAHVGRCLLVWLPLVVKKEDLMLLTLSSQITVHYFQSTFYPIFSLLHGNEAPLGSHEL